VFDRLLNVWDRLRTSLWLLPGVFLLLAVGLRWVALQVDARVDDAEALRAWYLYSGSGDDARNLLTTLVNSLITMATLMFSITMVVLSLAAAQFGSRLVRTYVAEVRTQLALGWFLMTILYCLLVLRSVEQKMDPADVPHVAVSLGLLLAVACIVVLLLFLHVVARSIVADTVVHRVARDLEADAERLLPAPEAAPPAEPVPALPDDFDARARVVVSHREGYVQAIEYDVLTAAASRRAALVVLECRAGAFLSEGAWLGRVYPPDAADERFAHEIRRAVLIGSQRTPVQDIEFSIRHLVDVALRALSFAINDPNTAIATIDRLRGALARILRKQLPSGVYRDAQGTLRVLAHETGFDGIFDAAFHQIRQAGAKDPAVVIHLLRAIGRLAEHVRTGEQRDGLLRHAALIARAGLAQPADESDLADIRGALGFAETKLRTSDVRDR
jgi:uncharacterized membrane protein